MTTNREQQQKPNSIGQVEEQLNNQADTAHEIQGGSELDKEVRAAANRDRSELDEILIEE